MFKKVFIASLLALPSWDVAHADPMEMSFMDGTVRLRGSYGLMAVGADEIVKPLDWELSHLYWRSTNVQIASAALEVDITPTWTAILKGSIGFGGTHHMEDYDWIPPYFTDLGIGGYSDKSVHDKTEMDKYFSVDGALRYNMVDDPIGSFGFLGGAKYTNVKWTAYGGSYLYSVGGVRNTAGSFADIAVGSYEQKLPVVYLGAEGTYRAGDWSFGGSGTAGVGIRPSSVDYHFLRTTKFEDQFSLAPEVSAALSAEYRIINHISFYTDAKGSWLFQSKGDTKATNWSTGASQTYYDLAGMGAYSASVSVGLKGSF